MHETGTAEERDREDRQLIILYEVAQINPSENAHVTRDLLKHRKQVTSETGFVMKIAQQDQRELTIYHDTSASGQGLSFRTGPNRTRELTRAEQVQQTARSVASESFDTNFRDHTGRPDVIVLEIESDDPLTYEYLITEVKHSTREETIREGIKQTLEYLAFLRVNEEYVSDREPAAETECFGSGWNGLPVVQDLDDETPSIADQASEPITILQAGELDEELRTVLENVLND